MDIVLATAAGVASATYFGLWYSGGGNYFTPALWSGLLALYALRVHASRRRFSRAAVNEFLTVFRGGTD